LLLSQKTVNFDFLEHNNFIMETIVLIFANNLCTITATMLIYKEIFMPFLGAFISQYVLNFIMLVAIIVFIWRGTDFYTFYNKFNLTIVISLMVL
jgi:hypothetical protein